MDSTDLEEFRTVLATLCAAFNVPPTKERVEAYRLGLKAMSLLQFGRVVEHLVGENGPDKMPTVPMIWAAAKSLRARAPQPPPAGAIEDEDSIDAFANRVMLLHVVGRQGLGSGPGRPSPELVECLQAKRDLVEYFREPITNRDELATPAHYIELWIRALTGLGSTIAPATLAAYRRQAAAAGASNPFSPNMARSL